MSWKCCTVGEWKFNMLHTTPPSTFHLQFAAFIFCLDSQPLYCFEILFLDRMMKQRKERWKNQAIKSLPQSLCVDFSPEGSAPGGLIADSFTQVSMTWVSKKKRFILFIFLFEFLFYFLLFSFGFFCYFVFFFSVLFLSFSDTYFLCFGVVDFNFQVHVDISWRLSLCSSQ